MTDSLPRTEPTSRTLPGRVALADPNALRAAAVTTLMLNVTLRCDLVCPRCHQSSSPSRTEEMSRDTMLDALRLAEVLQPVLVDVTGGEPALWPHLRELVERARATGRAVRVRTNLVALARPECRDLPAFFAEHRVAVLGSLPQGGAIGDDGSRSEAAGGPMPDAALDVLRAFAALGYGTGGGLVLDLAHNPAAGELPRDERELTEELHAALDPLGVRFDAVREIANVPVGRFGRSLELAGTYRAYIDRLADGFNPDVVAGLVCRHGIDVAWDGALFDCDFNMGADRPAIDGPRSVAAALALHDAGADALAALTSRRIAFGEHCFACTVGAGSG